MFGGLDKAMEASGRNCEDNRPHGVPDDWYKDAALMRWPPKEQISIRIDEDILKFFRNQGKGYQTKINAVLRAFMDASSASSTGS